MTSNPSSADKRTRLLEAALCLFTELGFQQTSTAAIARAAGVAAGTLFLYFPSKEALLNTLYVEMQHEQAAHAQAGLAPTDAGIEALFRRVWQQAGAWMLAHPTPFRFLQMFKYMPTITAASVQQTDAAYAPVVALTEAARAAGYFPGCSTDLLLSLFNGQLVGTVQYLLRTPTEADAPAVLGRTFESFWRGLVPTTGP